MEFRILGRLEVVHDGQDLTPPRPKQRALLALLLLRAGELVTADEAADALWHGSPPPAARNAVQGHVAALRKRLGRDRIETHDAGYVLHVDEDELDLHRFERLVTSARGEPPEQQSELLARALGLFRGAPLEDFRYEDFAAAEAARIEELRLLAVEARLDAELALGRHEEVVPDLERHVVEAPLRERSWAQLVLALYRSGRQADALDAHRRARRALDELGLDPGPELQQLERRVLQQDPALDLVPPGARVRLPSPPTSFLGRSTELDELAELLRSGRRIVTLVGPGGSGKTRLAVEAARRATAAFAGGVVFVPLAPLETAELVLPTLAHALGVREDGRPLTDAIASQLGDRATLVVLDNVEHVSAAVPALGELVAAAPALALLATSREPLRLYGEHLYRVQPLDADTADALFVARADAVGAHRPDAAVVHEICRRLDRLPLAIELAAARADVLEPAALLTRLEEPLEVLTVGAADHHPRQQTLRLTLEWSHERLAPPEQLLFARLAAFAGGWTVDAADAVCGEGVDAVRALSSLLDKSLVQPSDDVSLPRQWMLETIREFARERLAASGEETSIRRRHASFFCDLAEAAEPHLRGTPGEWLDRLEREHANLRAALEHGGDELRTRLAGALWRFWYLRGHLTEGRLQLERALATAPPGADRAKALIGAAVMTVNTGDADGARAHAAEALALCRESGDAWGAAYASFMLGNVARNAGAAREHYEQAIGAFRALGDEHSALLASRHLALLLGETGAHDEARRLHEDNLARARATGNGRIAASTLGALAEGELRSGRRGTAVELLRESLELHRELGDALDTVVDLCRFAAAIGGEDPERAATILGAFEAAGDAASGRRGWVADLNEETIRSVCARLGEAAAERAVATGRALSLDQAIELALMK